MQCIQPKLTLFFKIWFFGGNSSALHLITTSMTMPNFANKRFPVEACKVSYPNWPTWHKCWFFRSLLISFWPMYLPLYPKKLKKNCYIVSKSHWFYQYTPNTDNMGIAYRYTSVKSQLKMFQMVSGSNYAMQIPVILNLYLLGVRGFIPK